MGNSGARAEGDNVVPISRAKEIRERRPPFKNASPSVSGGAKRDDKSSGASNRDNGPSTTSDKEKQVSATTCAYMLNGLAPLADSLEKLLEIPEKLFMSDDLSSFTSEPGKHVVAMARALAYDEPPPKGLPGYGVCLFKKDSTMFCLLVDKRRKVAVFNSISNHGGPGDWDLFEDSLAEALEQAKKLQLGGEEFSFVLMNRFIGSRIDPENLAKSEECVRTLNALAPMSEKLKLYLLMPKSLYAGEGKSQFTSEPDKHLDVAAISSSTVTSVPPDLPHYGITTFTEGGKVMCALVDLNRRIIVIEEVLDTKTRQGSWERFEASLVSATDRAAELQVDAKLDHFIIARNGMIEG